MEFQNVFQEMLNVTAAPPDPVAEALRRAGIPADAPYYAGAFQNVEQALASRKPQSVAFWQAYLLSMCGQLEQLERTAEPEDDPSVSLAAASCCGAGFVPCRQCCTPYRTQNEPRANREKPPRPMRRKTAARIP